MSNAAKSILVYGIYLLILSVVLLLIPNVPLSIFGIPTTNEVWIRVVGAMLVAFGTYYVRGARSEVTELFRWSVPSRLLLVVFFAAFVVAGLAPINIMLLAIFDIPFVIWTFLALRSSTSESPLRARPTERTT